MVTTAIDLPTQTNRLAVLQNRLYVPYLFANQLGCELKQAFRATAFLLAAAMLCFVSAFMGSALAKVFSSSGTHGIPYADFIAILLTAISLLITLLAFIISILAFIGWNSISGKVASDVKTYLNDGFKDGAQLHTMVREELRAEKTRVMYEGVMAVDAEFDRDAEAEDAGERR